MKEAVGRFGGGDEFPCYIVSKIPGRNVAIVDLFELDHARDVLAAFARAFGQLPENAHDTTIGRIVTRL